MTSSFAFVFPGQGSQQVGMLAALAQEHTIIQTTFAEASAALGYDLWQLTQQGPESDLNQTDKTQPALLVAGVALWRLWQAEGGAQPQSLAGHSLGEYTALTCAGALALSDAVKLVQLRGQLMQQAVPAGEGAMAAILGLADEAVVTACATAAQGQIVAAANFNCPGQVVIAGEQAAVERAIEACKVAGAKRAVPLAVSVPSHCELMRPAADKFAQALADIQLQLPNIPVLQNVRAKPAESLEQLRTDLVAQLYSPVLWRRTVEAMASAGIDATIECGPGKVLSGLNKKIHKPLSVCSLQDPAGLSGALSLVEGK